MNPMDLVAIALIVVAVILGVRSGALPQLLGLSGAAIAALAGLAILPAATPLLDAIPPAIRAIIVLSILLGLVGLGEAIGATGGRAMSKALGTGFLGALDQVSGAFVGVAQAILVLWLAGGVIASGPFTSLSELAQRSTRAPDRRLGAAAADGDRARARPGPRRHGPAERLHRPRAAAGAGHRAAVECPREPDRRAGRRLRAARGRRRLRPAGERLGVRGRAQRTS